MTRRVLDEHGGEKHRKVFALGEYEGHRYFEIREFFVQKGKSEWKPTRKGITLNRDTYRVLRDLIEREDEAIMDWIGVGYVPEEISRYEEVQEQAATDNRYQSGELVIDEYDEPRDVRFFDISHEGGEDHLRLNMAHPLFARLAGEGEATQRLLGAVLQAYHHARVMLADTPAFDPETIFMHLEQDWAKYLRDALKDNDG